jgi:hypothetical protein
LAGEAEAGEGGLALHGYLGACWRKQRFRNGIAILTGWCYEAIILKTLTVKINESLDRWLASEARRLRRTKSEIVRQALVQQRNGEKPLSLHDRMKEVCGIIKGPQDLATNPKYMEGFGE